MKYIEAYELMKDGADISREAWDYETAEGVKDEKFCWMVKNTNHVLLLKFYPNLNVGHYLPLVEDSDAEDWYVKDTTWSQKASKNLVDPAIPVDATVM